jgi:hypothetical protein
MLENAALLLLPWSARRSRPERAILDPDTWEPLGFACHRTPSLPWWFAWAARSGLEVHEVEDESLLLTLSNPWLNWGTWEIFDAEDHLVGMLRGGTLLNRLGQPLAEVQQAANNHDLCLVNPEGYELATVVESDGGDRLTFGGEVAGDPFAKMVVLAGVLVLTNRRSG